MTKIEEIWKDIPNYEGLYQVSNLGKVKSLWYGKSRLLKLNKDEGYLRVKLYDKNNVKSSLRVHRLVALTFIPIAEDKIEINHINGVKDDNQISNLEWVTHSQNIKHAYSIGLLSSKHGSKNGHSKLTNDDVLFIRTLSGMGLITRNELAKSFNITPSNIYMIVNNKTWNKI